MCVCFVCVKQSKEMQRHFLIQHFFSSQMFCNLIKKKIVTYLLSYLKKISDWDGEITRINRKKRLNEPNLVIMMHFYVSNTEYPSTCYVHFLCIFYYTWWNISQLQMSKTVKPYSRMTKVRLFPSTSRNYFITVKTLQKRHTLTQNKSVPFAME